MDILMPEMMTILAEGGHWDQIKKFTRPMMKASHRIIWYIHSQMMVLRSGNYTHFTSRDYRPLVNIVVQHPVNLGGFIHSEWQRNLVDKPEKVDLAFGPLISLILQKNKIWHLEGKARKPVEFGVK